MAPAISSCNNEFRIGMAESLSFARLSADYNPLHVDAIYARRTPFGGTVVHGMHLVLKSLDCLSQDGLLDGNVPGECSVAFNNPVATDASVSVSANLDTATRRLRLNGVADQRPAFSATFVLARAATESHSPLVDHFEHPRIAPRTGAFPPNPTEGAVPLQTGRIQLQALFPHLQRYAESAWIADLLATTRIVGMECPGMNSIYSGCKLQRVDRTEPPASSMRYKVTKVHERFKLIRLHIEGGYFQGSLETFFRPPPVDQPSLSAIERSVQAGSFEGHHALVIGGSRGLGELAAKIVLAGGGRVTLTYAKGQADAQRICEEARVAQRDCRAEQLDVAALLSDNKPGWLTSETFTHVYYFASPHISRNAAAAWDRGLFVRFTLAYVDAFAALVQTVAQAAAARQQQVRFLYPSSIFVAQPEKGFAEYAAAKAAGEFICDHFARQYQTTVAHPRLPRMRTDQTSALIDAGVQEPLPVMLETVRRLHA